jgi:1-deoxy-D-xylulose 5-phosphate reductoisomerase
MARLLRPQRLQLQALVPLEQLFAQLQEYRPMEVAMYDAHVRHKCRKAQQQRVQAAVDFHAQQQKDLYEFVDEEKASKLVTVRGCAAVACGVARMDAAASRSSRFVGCCQLVD